jgi:DNA-binding NarL/FixJ family response regulator
LNKWVVRETREIAIEAVINVAVVDDHLLIAEMLSKMVEGESDMRFAGTANSVAAASELVDKEHPDVVLMDYRLPDGTGIDAVKNILQRWPETRIVMLSGDSSHDLMVRAIEAGCVGMLAKDRPMDELLGAIRSASKGELVFRADEMNKLLTYFRKSPSNDLDGLTTRELEVLQLLAEGVSTDGIAEKLFISINTVRNHVSKILMKLGAHSKLEAVAIAARDKLVTLHH